MLLVPHSTNPPPTCLQVFTLHVRLAVGGLGEGERLAEDRLVLHVLQHAPACRVRHRSLVQHLAGRHRERVRGRSPGLGSNTSGVLISGFQLVPIQFQYCKSCTRFKTCKMCIEREGNTGEKEMFSFMSIVM